MARHSLDQCEAPAGPAIDAPASLYFLTPHSFLCRADGILIFLDLKNDEYLCLQPADSDAVGRRLGLAPPFGAEDAGGDPVMAELVDAGLLTKFAAEGRPACLVEGGEAVREIPRFDIGAGPKVKAGHVAAFLRALFVARMLLRLAPMARIVRRVARRRASRLRPPEAERARELTEIYRKLRPLFLSRKDQCLLNSLLLIEFLARFDLYPAWHFGVRLREFSAHCWVQEGSLLYDDDVENVCKYSVIMKA